MTERRMPSQILQWTDLHLMAGPDGNGCVDLPSPLQMAHRTILILVVGGTLLADRVRSAEPLVNVLSCVSGNQTVLVDPTAAPAPSKLFLSQYHIKDPSFVLAQVCADLNNAGDWKIGNSPVIIDADHNGVPDGYVGTRGGKLARLNLVDLTAIKVRTPWGQCGCHTSALDVDHDGRWDLFAGSGDDHGAKGTIHRYDPLTLRSIWSYKTNDNASSADMVLADIDGDGQVEIIKSVDNYADDDAHDAIYAFATDGTMLWKIEDTATGFLPIVLRCSPLIDRFLLNEINIRATFAFLPEHLRFIVRYHIRAEETV